MKVAFGIIVFNGNNTLEESLKVIYPYASQILIAEGPVAFWQRYGYTTSTDGTNEMIDSFPDPENKIKIVHSQYEEKLEQTNAYMEFLDDDIDYLWNLDSDQVFKPEDMDKIFGILRKSRRAKLDYTLATFSSLTFFGGFDRYITGFEERAKFPGIFRVYPGTRWGKHRYPSMEHKQEFLPTKVLSSTVLANDYGIRMYHYGSVFAEHVYQKIKYYKEFVGKLDHGVIDPKKDIIIDNYFGRLFLPWIRGSDIQRQKIEKKYNGVHEFKPEKRGASFTAKFKGKHPKVIQDNMDKLMDKFNEQLGRKYG